MNEKENKAVELKDEQLKQVSGGKEDVSSSGSETGYPFTASGVGGEK